MSLFTETVTLHIPGEAVLDEDGNPVYDNLGNPLVEPDRDDVWLAWYEERTSTEALDAREQRVWGYWLYLPLDAPLTAGVTVTLSIDEHTYRVVGQPGRQPGGFIVEGYIRAAIEDVAG